MQLIRQLEETRASDAEMLRARRERSGTQSARRGIIYYAGLHYEQKGHLEFVHSVTGVRTLKDELEKLLLTTSITWARSGRRFQAGPPCNLEAMPNTGGAK